MCVWERERVRGMREEGRGRRGESKRRVRVRVRKRMIKPLLGPSFNILLVIGYGYQRLSRSNKL